MILDGKKIAKQYKTKTVDYITKNNLTGKFVRIIFVGNNYGSRVYVGMKTKYAVKIGLKVKVSGQGNEQFINTKEIIQCIKESNKDKDCVGIMVQLPLPEESREDQAEILGAICPEKDIDGLAGVQFGRAMISLIDFLPATPLAIINLLKGYNLDDFRGKKITILGQSNLIGKPLATYLMGEGATVFSFNHLSNQELMKRVCIQSDYIISCTGKVHLVDKSFVCDDKSQIIVDVGWGKKDGKPAGDVNIDSIKDRVLAYTPVPGGVGPMTIASLFWNICILDKYYL